MVFGSRNEVILHVKISTIWYVNKQEVTSAVALILNTTATVMGYTITGGKATTVVGEAQQRTWNLVF